LKSGNINERLCLSKMKRWETAVLNRAEKVFFISDADAELTRNLLKKNCIQVMPNGVYFDDYHERKLSLPSPSIGYLGNMSYRPNIDAAMRVFSIYKKLKEKFPRLTLYIIGRDPAPEILILGREPGVVVTGTVDDIWEYVNAVDIFLLPVFMGAGQQNKLLEVLYAAKPAVVSSAANGGILAKSGHEVFVDDAEAGMLAIACKLLSDPLLRQTIGHNGRDFVERTYSWATIATKYGHSLTK
jgi:glycosyltransferase involved in cell wall biosynthesis